MKTWINARHAHKGRFDGARRFMEVLSQLEAAGAPPPDDVGLCHADWQTTKYSVCRVNMALKNEVCVSGGGPKGYQSFRDAFAGQRAGTTPTEVADLVQRFATFLKVEYAPEMWQYPTEVAGKHEMDGDYFLRGTTERRLLTGPWRASPYFVPSEGWRPSWEALIKEREQLLAALDEAYNSK